jgi:uncharacterized protein (TIGR02271 family)
LGARAVPGYRRTLTKKAGAKPAFVMLALAMRNSSHAAQSSFTDCCHELIHSYGFDSITRSHGWTQPTESHRVESRSRVYATATTAVLRRRLRASACPVPVAAVAGQSNRRRLRGKEVVSEQRTLEVPVTREEVTIERHPVDRRPTDRPMDEQGQTISIPVHEEQVELEKTAVVYEKVGVGTREVQDTQQASGTVRREEARIEREGDVAGAHAA